MHGVTTIRKTLAQVEAEGQVLPDGTLMVYVSCTDMKEGLLFAIAL